MPVSISIHYLSNDLLGGSLIATGMAISKPITEQTIEEYKKQMSVNGEQFHSRLNHQLNLC